MYTTSPDYPSRAPALTMCRGATWKAYGYLSTKGSWLIENALVELSDGRLMMVFRTRLQKIYVSYSHDKGRTWGTARSLSTFPNPNSKVLILTLVCGVQYSPILDSLWVCTMSINCMTCIVVWKVDLTRLEPNGELVLVYNHHVNPNKVCAIQELAYMIWSLKELPSTGSAFAACSLGKTKIAPYLFTAAN